MLALEKCRNRRLYRVNSRNLEIAVFDEQRRTFVGIREKFGATFADSELHRELGGTAAPLEELPDSLPDDISIETHLGTVCDNCNAEVAFDPETKWSHVGETTCDRIRPVSNTNMALYEWLMAAQARYQKPRDVY